MYRYMLIFLLVLVSAAPACARNYDAEIRRLEAEKAGNDARTLPFLNTYLYWERGSVVWCNNFKQLLPEVHVNYQNLIGLMQLLEERAFPNTLLPAAQRMLALEQTRVRLTKAQLIQSGRDLVRKSRSVMLSMATEHAQFCR